MKLLKEKSLSCSFGKDQVQLIIESYKPRSSSLNEASHNLTDSIIVSGLSPGSQSWMLKAYLNQFGLKCDDPQMIDGGASAIVKLNTKAGIENNFLMMYMYLFVLRTNNQSQSLSAYHHALSVLHDIL